jgi:predicted Zn-dependent protease
MTDLTQQLLDLVAEHAAGAEAEATAETQTLALTRFADSFIHQNVADTTTTVRLRLHRDGRTATGSTTVTSADGLRALVEQTVAASDLLPVDAGWPGVTPPSELTSEGNYDPATAEAEPAVRATVVRDFVDAAGGLVTAGYCRTVGIETSFANTAGHQISGRTSGVAVDAIARAPGSDGVARTAGVRIGDIDGAALGVVAATKARAGADPVDLEPGQYEVVLEPSAVIDIVSQLALYGFNGKAVAEHRSFVELGAGQFDESISLVDDPTGPGATSLPFDTDGTPKAPLDLVRDGVSVAVAHDRRTAKELGATTTGHAWQMSAVFGPFAATARIEPGTASPAEPDGRPVSDPAVAGLLATVKRGLLVSDLWYTRVLDPRQVVLTGLTRNGVWLVENGEIVRPVTNLRFTQSYPAALAPGQVRGVGARIATVPYNWGVMCVGAPTLHLASWQFTGGSAG